MAKPWMLLIQSGAFLRMRRPWLSCRSLHSSVSLAPKATPLHKPESFQGVPSNSCCPKYYSTHAIELLLGAHR